MSHAIFIPCEKPSLRGLLSAVTRASWADGVPPADVPDDEGLLATEGSARGVAISFHAATGGVVVRLLACSSRADVELAVDLAATLIAAGGAGAVNEDNAVFASVDALRAHYDAAFVDAYVAWGPAALAEQLAEARGTDSVQLGGPYAVADFTASEIRAWRDTGDAALRDGIVGRLVETQKNAQLERSGT